VQGKGEEGRERLLAEAARLEEAGAFSVVLELIPGSVAEAVTAAVSIPTIGIGAGVGCDGQVLVLEDMLGINTGFNPRFLRRFAELGEGASAGIGDFVRAVKGGEYPTPEHTFS
jgi:3-methyl-2-oxobutanoate hydroxymethyltransferase